MIFRDSHKFVGMLALVYSMLGSYGMHSLMRRFSASRNRLLAAFFICMLGYNFGIFILGGQNRPSLFPSDWVDADKIIAADPVESNILILPPYLYSHYPWINSAQRTAGPVTNQFFSKPVITEQSVLTRHVYNDINDPRGRYVSLLFENRQFINDTASALLPLNVRYVVLFKNYSDSDHYLWLFKRRGGVRNITLAYESGSIYLFRNELAGGPFLASMENGSGNMKTLLYMTGKGLYSTNISHEKITPASYRIIDLPYPYVVFMAPPNRYMESDGNKTFSWHRLGNAFQFSGPAMLTKRLFYRP
jgi:hypothetical protein